MKIVTGILLTALRMISEGNEVKKDNLGCWLFDAAGD